MPSTTLIEVPHGRELAISSRDDWTPTDLCLRGGPGGLCAFAKALAVRQPELLLG